MALVGRDPDPGTAAWFEVQVDGLDLGAFTSCEGLGAEFEVFEYMQGGENTYIHKLPGRMKYTTVKLSRPVDAKTSAIGTWFKKLRDQVTRGNGKISVYDGNKKLIAQWELAGMYPVRWTGPSLTAEGNQVAKETLELAHNGFLS